MKAQFITERSFLQVSKKILKEHLSKHINDFKRLSSEHSMLKNYLETFLGRAWTEGICRTIRKTLKNLKQLKTKADELFSLKKKQTPISQNTYEVPIINLFSYKNINLDGLKKGLNHSFVNKHKGNRRNLALELESLAEKAETFVSDEEKEVFHEYLRKITNTLSMNVEHA